MEGCRPRPFRGRYVTASTSIEFRRSLCSPLLLSHPLGSPHALFLFMCTLLWYFHPSDIVLCSLTNPYSVLSIQFSSPGILYQPFSAPISGSSPILLNCPVFDSSSAHSTLLICISFCSVFRVHSFDINISRTDSLVLILNHFPHRISCPISCVKYPCKRSNS